MSADARRTNAFLVILHVLSVPAKSAKCAKQWKLHLWGNSFAGLYIIEFPRPVGWVIKGFKDGEENPRGGEEKKRKFKENINFGCTK